MASLEVERLLLGYFFGIKLWLQLKHKGTQSYNVHHSCIVPATSSAVSMAQAVWQGIELHEKK